MNARLQGISAAAAISLLTAPVAAGQSPQTPVLLRVVPPEGQVSRYAMSIEIEMDNPMMPSSGPLVTMRLFHTQTVVGAAEEVIRYLTTFDSTTMSTATPVPGADLPDLSGLSFTWESDTRGRPLEVTESESMPSGFSGASLIEQLSHFVLPEEEVAPGASWTVDAPMNVPMGPGASGSGEVAATYTFDSLDGSIATLSLEGPMEMEIDMAGMAVAASGTVTGSMVVDLAEGRYRSRSGQVVLNLAMGGMNMTMTTTTSLELLPDP